VTGGGSVTGGGGGGSVTGGAGGSVTTGAGSVTAGGGAGSSAQAAGRDAPSVNVTIGIAAERARRTRDERTEG
jgi:hypothetical protein